MNDLVIYDKTICNIPTDDENCINPQEGLGHTDATVCRVIQCTFEPLDTCSLSCVHRQSLDMASKTADALATHGVALVSHSRRANLIFAERFFNFFVVLHEADVICHFVGTCSNLRKKMQNLLIKIAGVSLPRNRINLIIVELELVSDIFLNAISSDEISAHQFHKGFLCAGCTSASEHFHGSQSVLKVIKVLHEILNPESCTFANSNGTRRLIMRIAKTRHILILVCKISQKLDNAKKAFPHQTESICIDEDVGVVGNIARSCSKMDDAFCFRTLLSISVDMCHHIMPNFFLTSFCNIIIDVVDVGPHLIDLLIRDVDQAGCLFRFCQSHPELTPVRKLNIVRKQMLHFLAGIPPCKRRLVDTSVYICHTVEPP